MTDDDAFTRAYEAAAMRQLSAELGPIFRQHGNGTVDRSAAVAELSRVAGIIQRDQVDAQRDYLREMANAQVANGAFENFADTVQEPTPEWMAKGPTRTFTPRQPEGTVRVVRSVRRVRSSTVQRLFDQGRMSAEHFAACRWYQDRHEAAGLLGRWKTSHLSLAGPGSGGGNAQAPMAQHAAELEARQEFRAARAAIRVGLVKLFEAVVIEDMALRRLALFARMRKSATSSCFRVACMDLLAHCDRSKIEISEDRLTREPL